MPTLPVTGFDHLSLLCKRHGETLRFYTRVLGFHVAAPAPPQTIDKWAMTELRAGEATLVLIDTTHPDGAWALSPPGPGENMHHFCLRLALFDGAALRQILRDANIAIEEESDDGRERAFYIRDPEGNLVELRGPWVGE